MNLYCTQENQQLLWNTISKVPQFQTLRKNNAQACESLFKTVIEEYYEEIGPRKIQVSELRTWNKKSVQKMMELLKQSHQLQQPSFQPSLSSSMTTTPLFSLEPNTTQTRGHLLEQKQNALNSQFQKRQDEYSQFLKKPQVEEIDFREKDENDRPLENVDSLLQHHMKEREYEHFNPPSQQNTNETTELLMKIKEEMQQEMTKMQETITIMQASINDALEEIKVLKEERQDDYTFRANVLVDDDEEESGDNVDMEEEENTEDSTIEESEIEETQT